MKARIAIVVQRSHERLVGGAEALAWQYAQLLSPEYDVEILTSTAMDYMKWDNDLEEGVEQREAVTVRRFRVTRGRTPYFHGLHRNMLDAFDARADQPPSERFCWPEALEEEFVRAQGPNSKGLLEYLEKHGDDYAAVFFLTYLYPYTLDGIRTLRHRRWALIPTLHDEPPAYLKTFARMAKSAPRILWNTQAERRLGISIWNHDAGNLVSMTVETKPETPAREEKPYILYCGRIDVSKGCAQLLDGFKAYKAANPNSPLQLILTGNDMLGVGKRADVRYLGFVEEQRKFELMAGAVAFVQPSPYESLSIVLLEAMAQRAPVIVNAECEALLDHVLDSRSGFAYRGESEFHAALDSVLALDTQARADQGTRAREYVLANYGRDEVKTRLVAEVEALAAN